jgi:hypothetical protein
MGNMVKCDQGHYYDQSQSSRCPFCGVSSINLDLTVKSSSPPDYATTAKAPPHVTNAINDGNTVAYDLRGKGGGSSGQDPEATRAIWTQKIGIDPVVGWLVCTKGANRGRDYRIRSGWNSIGRDPAMQICIASDDTISREDHAKLFFDSKTAAFHITAGDGRSGVYVNGSAVLQPLALKQMDEIEVGNTTLVFVPLCGGNFAWGPEA